jgi:hypothetical protein
VHPLRRVVVVIVCAGLFAACTSPTTKKRSQSTAAENASVVGISGSEIKVALITVDLSLLTKEHLAPDLGNPVKVAHAVVDDINAHGGVADHNLVLTTHTIASATPSADLLQQVCTQATEEDHAFATIITAAVPVNVAQCTAVTHDQLTIGMDSWQQDVYHNAQGRLFSLASQLSANIERTYAAFPALLQKKGALTGKTVGILNQDQPPDRTAAAKALKTALQGMGISVAAEATAPYEAGNTSCSQTDVAVQKMVQAHVNFVFLVAQNLCAASLVASADKAGFKPQWATVGNNVTNTVAQFMAPSKANYDGAWGMGGSLAATSPTSKACNNIVATGAGLHFAPTSDAYGFAAVTCMQIQSLATAISKAQTPLNQGSVIRALEAMTAVPMDAGPSGSLSATKHDAGDYAWLQKYSAATGTFQLIDPTPQRVP